MSVRSPSPETQPDSPCRAWPLRRVGQPSPDARNGIGELGRRPSDSAADRIVCAVAGPDFSQALLNGYVLAVWARDHVAVGQHAGKRVWRGLELPAQDVGESAFFGFDDGAGVVGDLSAQHGVGMLGVAEVPDAVEGMQARGGQAGRVADVMQPGGFEQIGVSAENRRQTACPGGHALDVCPAAGEGLLEEYLGELSGPGGQCVHEA